MMRSCAVLAVQGLVAVAALVAFLVWPGWPTALLLALVVLTGWLLPKLVKHRRVRRLAATVDLLRTRLPDEREQFVLALARYAAVLFLAGRLEQALAVSGERVEQFRALLGTDRRTRLKGYGQALDEHCSMLALAGRPLEALDLAAEAVRIRREGLGEWRGGPDFHRDVAVALAAQVRLLSAAGRHEEAARIGQEALAVLEGIGARDDYSYLPSLAGVLDTIAACERAAGRQEEALAAAQEAVECCEKLFRVYAGEYLSLYARVTGTRARILSSTDPAEALSASEAMVELTRSAARQDALVHAPARVVALTAHARVLSAAGQTRQGRRTARLALSEARRTAPELLPETRRQLTGLL
ncbi:tetratricopeptide repeat protein [Nonomuraea sp. NPDC050540]|uniref:tetratricopeptide repeat protein n=1 Tax=Nonomuraea sp. NPDC050540 TaxID=3364367 RepID=UPI0037AE058E